MSLVRRLAVATLLPLASVSAQRSLDLTGRPDAAIGEPFTLVAGVRELAGGRAIVTDQMDRTIALVDFAAGTRRTIGRQGDGPGEYRFPTAPFAGRADTTWVVDPVLRRLHVVSGDGRIVAGPGLPSGAVPGGLGAARGTDRQGHIYFEGSAFDQERGAFIDTVAIVRWDPAGGRTDVIARVSNGGRVRLNRPEGVASLARTITPFPHLDAWTVLPDGQVAVVHHDPFRIDMVRATGDVRRGSVIPFTPIDVSAADRAAYHERVANSTRMGALRVGGGSGPQRQAPQYPDDAFPKSMPPFIAATVRSTPEGEIWIGRSHSAGDRSWRYDIFDASGRAIGTATLRAGGLVVGFGAGTVYVARTDPTDDLVYLERYRR